MGKSKEEILAHRDFVAQPCAARHANAAAHEREREATHIKDSMKTTFKGPHSTVHIQMGRERNHHVHWQGLQLSPNTRPANLSITTTDEMSG